jgi:uncharacterized membrane protein YbhN (UPF0104 family)
MTSRSGATFWIKVIVTVTVLAAVFLRVDLSSAASALAHTHWPLFLLSLGLTVPLGFTAVQRWRGVAVTFGETLPISKAFIYIWIGQFINLGFPTVLGLDSVRAWKMHTRGMPLGLATRIVVVDRLCSLFTLLIIIAVALPHLWALQGSEIFKQSTIFVFALGCTALTCLSASEWVGRANFALGSLRHLHTLSKDFNHALFGSAATSLKISLWGLLNHFFRVVIVCCLALALGLPISMFDAFTLVPSALLIAMVPITLGGWGIREMVFIEAFSLVGVAAGDALALSLLYGLVFSITGLLGGAVWFAERRAARQQPEARESEHHA